LVLADFIVEREDICKVEGLGTFNNGGEEWFNWAPVIGHLLLVINLPLVEG